jgi:predicted dehydrogenase
LIRIGLVGYGYWGPNIVRNFARRSDSDIVAICDVSQDALNHAKKLHSDIQTFTDYRDLIKLPQVDAVAVVTPLKHHYAISQLALASGKHLFVEKPFTETSEQAMRLIDLAEKNNLILMVDHTFIFTDAVEKIKELVDKQELGELLYYDSTRVNLGLFRSDVNVIWDLAPHDFSIMQYLLKEQPLSLSALGMAHYTPGLYNTAYITLYFEKMIAHFNFNWLSPVKIRATYIGGDKKMLIWDDLKSDEKIKIYDKGIIVEDDRDIVYQQRIGYRLGDMVSPHLGTREALHREADYFVECIMRHQKPINDGVSGRRGFRKRCLSLQICKSLWMYHRRPDEDRRLRRNSTERAHRSTL